VTNPLVAQAHSSTTWYTGLGLVEDAAQISNGIQNNSWVDGTLGTVGGALDIVGMAIDPLGSLVAWGVSWLMEHVKPLKEALDWLAGNPDEIAAHAQTWGNVSKFTAEAGLSYQEAIRFETATWVGESGDAYREHAGAHLAVLEGISKATNGVSYAVMGAGLLVGLVRGIVRDLIAQFVGTLAARLPQWLAEAGLTLGIGTPVVIGQVVALVAKWVNKIQGFIRALLNSLRRLKPMLGKLGDILTELKALLRKLARRDPMKPGADLLDPHARPHSTGAGSGPWVEPTAVPGGAVAQSSEGACVSACGEMLTNGRISQSDLLDNLGEWSTPNALRDHLNNVDTPGWHGGYFVDDDAAVQAARSGTIAVTLQSPMQRGQHMVITEPLPDGTFRVRDPYGGGSTYIVNEDWIRQYVAGGVYR
jgi:hypothetical protein